jgi:type II secretion system protein I
MTCLPDGPRPRPQPCHQPRRGITLIEVVVSMTILLFSMVALSQLISLGSDRAMEVQQISLGTMLAQRKLAEFSIGAIPPSSVGYTPFEEDGMSDWQWKLEVDGNSINGLYNVQVSVKFAPQDAPPGLTIELGRMALDPTLRGSNQDPPVAQQSSDSSSSSNTNSASSSNSNSGSGNSSAAAAAGGIGPGANKTGKTGNTNKTGAANTPARTTPTTPNRTTPNTNNNNNRTAPNTGNTGKKGG